MLRMLHPSSGRGNFDVVSTQTANNNNNNQASQAINETQDTVQTVDKKEIEEKTKKCYQKLMMKMFHPSSGRNNFKDVPEKSNNDNKTDKSSTKNIQDQNSSESQLKRDIETKTKDAINNAVKSHSSDDSKTINKN
ncbi:unnamed protein product [Adineta steineri]|uniref:Uncharacterized protein n=2 Tax=Adineta steineri TaxID=433720 RepID=A0A814QI06_9BILA|nr:unnamed protein product [Adineta steineri]